MVSATGCAGSATFIFMAGLRGWLDDAYTYRLFAYTGRHDVRRLLGLSIDGRVGEFAIHDAGQQLLGLLLPDWLGFSGSGNLDDGLARSRAADVRDGLGRESGDT